MKQRNRLQGIIAVAVAVAFCAALVVVYEAARGARRSADRAEQTTTEVAQSTYENRAASCRNTVILVGGFKPGDPCLDAPVLRYYDIHEIRPTPLFACQIFAQFHVALPTTLNFMPADCAGR